MSNQCVEEKPKGTKVRQCARCGAMTPMRHNARLCDSCINKCSMCHVQPNNTPKDNYCPECRRKVNDRRRKFDPETQIDLSLVCARCGGEKLPSKKVCEACAKICSICLTAPVEIKNHCKPCEMAVRRLAYRRQDPELKLRRILRTRLRQEIKAGLREAHACQICDHPDTQLFVTDAKRGFYAFLCKEHHAEFMTLYRLKDKYSYNRAPVSREMVLQNRYEWENRSKRKRKRKQ